MPNFFGVFVKDRIQMIWSAKNTSLVKRLALIIVGIQGLLLTWYLVFQLHSTLTYDVLLKGTTLLRIQYFSCVLNIILTFIFIADTELLLIFGIQAEDLSTEDLSTVQNWKVLAFTSFSVGLVSTSIQNLSTLYKVFYGISTFVLFSSILTMVDQNLQLEPIPIQNCEKVSSKEVVVLEV
ncbi:unnamed protein product [Allacma fusca]|uniref:Uncharacterized protein n=1 Tax=Allacma fusca TaxID=39272 RepID=A0A8J2Q0N5_9HEXA|nr:unnamed protein product [Allacma fusca]